MRFTLFVVFGALVASAQAQYILDDGTNEGSVGLTAGGTIAWANQFTAIAGSEVITSIEIAWGRSTTGGVMVPDGTPTTVQLWSDPNGDGDPGDSVLLASVAGTTLNLGDTFSSYDIPDTVFSAGDNFFVGAGITHAAGEFPASIDTTSSAGQSWIAIGTDFSGTRGTDYFLVDDIGLPGNWMVRATGAPVPEPASMLAISAGIAGLIARRRRK